MSLSNQAHFNYDNPTSSSNPPRPPPTRDGGSGIGGQLYRDFISGFGEGGRGSASGSGRGFGDRTSNHARPRDGSSDRGNHYRGLFNGQFAFGGGHGSAGGRGRDFDDRTSNPAGPRNSSSDRGNHYRGLFNGQFGFGGGQSSGGTRRNDNSRFPRGRDERSMDTILPSHLSEDDLRDIAISTLQTLDEGEYFPPGAVDPYDLTMKIQWTDDNTRYYGPDAGEGGEILESEFIRINEEGGNEGKDEKEEEGDKTSAGEQDKNACSMDGTQQAEDGSDNVATAASEAENKQMDDNSNPKAQPDAIICIGEYSTLVGARKLHLALASSADPSLNKKIGILNFASSKKPGGEFISGLRAQQESIVRASTLYPSLITPAAFPFYTHHRDDPSNAYYTHAMVYSPGVVLLRDDNGEWRSPVEADVLTSTPVNAGEIRRGLEKEERLRREREEMEIWRRGKERRKEKEKAMAEKEEVMTEKEILRKEKEMLKEQEKLKKEKKKAWPIKLWKGMTKSRDGNGTKETEKEKEKEKEKENQEETATDNPDEKATDNPGSGSSPDGEVKPAEENTKSKGASIQDVQPQSKEPTSSTTMLHPLSQTQLLEHDPEITYIRRLQNAEFRIQYTMYIRISRILHLFQLQQIPYLILGSFGTGVFQNHTDLVATIFAELLVKPGGRFKNVFKTVVFAILGRKTVSVFLNVFLRVEKRAKRTRGETGGSCLLWDEDRNDGEVREEAEERMMRMMRWEARRTAKADAASFAAVHADLAAQAEIDAAAAAAAAVDTVPTAPDDDRIAEDEKMILTEDEEVDFVFRETLQRHYYSKGHDH
ncbi:hypothetical protein BYT27DRAFT_7196565 [Phlegmacium glaucopus]|nr:hypothetical protein BYT27DRAFT_7196565 [Phlegmacium glaucopus]